MKGRRRETAACLLLIAATGWAFAETLDNGFVNYDDPMYVTNNWDVQGGLSFESIVWAFTDPMKATMWHPLTWLSLQADYQFHHLNARGFHLTNLLLHLANTLLVFILIRWLTGTVWRSAAVAGFFALHPLHVESVAWIAERKDVLGTFFYLLTILAYLGYAAKPKRDRYLLVLIAFALGLMAKPMLVTAPCVLLLLDCWPLRRMAWDSWRIRVLEKTPHFVLAGITCWATLYTMGATGVVKSMAEVSFAQRLANAALAYVVYLRKMVWPTDLAPFYPFQPPSAQAALGALLVLGGISGLALSMRKHRPYVLFGWCWFLGILVPVIGLVKFGRFAYADRFTYLPLVGIFWAVVWLMVEKLPAWLSCGTLLLLLAGCLGLTRQQVRTWHDSLTLWEHTLRVTTDNYPAHDNLALELLGRGNSEEALGHLRKACQVLPDYPPGTLKLGRLLDKLDRSKEALPVWRRYVELQPNDANAHEYLADCLEKCGDIEGARQQNQIAAALRKMAHFR